MIAICESGKGTMEKFSVFVSGGNPCRFCDVGGIPAENKECQCTDKSAIEKVLGSLVFAAACVATPPDCCVPVRMDGTFFPVKESVTHKFLSTLSPQK